MITTVCRKEHFNAAHRLQNPNWTDEKNAEIFGRCANPHYHGHNYEVIVKLRGKVDPETGYLYDLKKLSDLISREVLNKFDHKNLNLDTEEFRNLNPTAENIAAVIWQKLRKQLPDDLALSITLFETERNFVEYDGQ